MKTAIISDIHGNIDALKSTLADIAKQNCGQIFCLGDVVGYGPNPRECIALLRERNIPTVRGNHDEVCATSDFPYQMNPTAQTAVIWTQEKLNADEKSWLKNLPLTIVQRETTFVHASPAAPEYWNYVVGLSEAQNAFQEFIGEFCFIGHSHQPLAWVKSGSKVEREEFDRVHFERSKRYIINVGSVGQPRDNDARAAYAIVDSNQSHCFLKRVAYDVKKTQRKIIAAGLPEKLADRLQRGW